MNGKQGNGTPVLTRRQFLGGALAAAGAIGAAGSACVRPLAASAAKPGRRPNLLFVFDDQHSWDMLGCYGNGQILTPNIDRLAGEGVRFNTCISCAPVCTPYRGILMTGQHWLNNGAMLNDLRMLPDIGTTFGGALRDAGYRTGYIGKWHINGGYRNRPIPAGPYRHGFDELFLSNNCTVDFRPGHCYYWNERGEKVMFQEWEPYGQTRQALEFLDSAAASGDDRPFALFVSWHPPHDHLPFRPESRPGGIRFDKDDGPDELMALYDPAKIRLRPNVPDLPDRRRQYRGYMAQCTGIDRAFGRLMDKLREKGFADNTVTIFTADHGDMLGSCGRPNPKSYPEDGSCRVPLVIRAPGLDAGRASDLFVGSIDMMPTVLGLLGVPVPGTCQGRNLAGAIRSGNDQAADSIPLFLGDWRGVLTRDHTYSFGSVGEYFNGTHTGDCNCLYDRRRDPHQRRNLFGDPAHKAVQDHLHRLSLEWMARYDDHLVDMAATVRVCCFETAPHDYEKPGRTGALRGRPVDLLRGVRGAV